MRFDEEERPYAVQIFGGKPERMAMGAEMAQEVGADILDVNCGCPAPKVVKNGGGSGLLREPKLLESILKEIKKTITIPLTLAIIDGFLVGVGHNRYVIPLDLVLECVELPHSERQASAREGHISLRGQVLPYLRLRQLFDLGGEAGLRENIVVVQYGGQKIGLVVDSLLGEFQTVIKPLGKLFAQLKGFGGFTILGSGEVALILDVPALIHSVVRAESNSAVGAVGPSADTEYQQAA